MDRPDPPSPLALRLITIWQPCDLDDPRNNAVEYGHLPAVCQAGGDRGAGLYGKNRQVFAYLHLKNELINESLFQFRTSSLYIINEYSLF